MVRREWERRWGKWFNRMDSMSKWYSSVGGRDEPVEFEVGEEVERAARAVRELRSVREAVAGLAGGAGMSLSMMDAVVISVSGGRLSGVYYLVTVEGEGAADVAPSMAAAAERAGARLDMRVTRGRLEAAFDVSPGRACSQEGIEVRPEALDAIVDGCASLRSLPGAVRVRVRILPGEGRMEAEVDGELEAGGIADLVEAAMERGVGSVYLEVRDGRAAYSATRVIGYCRR